MRPQAKEFKGKNLEAALCAAEEFFETDRRNLAYRVLSKKTTLFGAEKEVWILAWKKNEDLRKDLESFLQFLKEKLMLEGNFSLIDSNREALIVLYTGPDSKILTSRHGEVLNAIQHLLNKLFAGIGRRIQVDSDGYRKKRERYLRRLAKEVAERVRRTGKEEELFPLDPYERRIVHIEVNKMEGVASISEGEGFMKRIKIVKLKDV